MKHWDEIERDPSLSTIRRKKRKPLKHQQRNQRFFKQTKPTWRKVPVNRICRKPPEANRRRRPSSLHVIYSIDSNAFSPRRNNRWTRKPFRHHQRRRSTATIRRAPARRTTITFARRVSITSAEWKRCTTRSAPRIISAVWFPIRITFNRRENWTHSTITQCTS